jgi:hypothetical protein
MSEFDEYTVGEKSVYCKGVLCVVGLICTLLIYTSIFAIYGLAIVTMILLCMQIKEIQSEAKKRAEIESAEPA